jgi:hypothetical protein
MDCYIIASTLEGGWGSRYYKKKNELTKEEGEGEGPTKLDSYLVNKITES